MAHREHLARFCALRYVDPRLQAALIKLKEYTGPDNTWELQFFLLSESAEGVEQLPKLWETFIVDALEGSKFYPHVPYVLFQLCKKPSADAIVECEDINVLFGQGETLIIHTVENYWRQNSKPEKRAEEGHAEVAAEIGDMLVRCYVAMISHASPAA